MRNTKYLAEFFSLGFLSLDTPLFNLIFCTVYCRHIGFRFTVSQVQVLTFKIFFFPWEIKIDLYFLL